MEQFIWNGEAFSVDLSTLLEGMYLVKVQTAGLVEVKN